MEFDSHGHGHPTKHQLGQSGRSTTPAWVAWETILIQETSLGWFKACSYQYEYSAQMFACDLSLQMNAQKNKTNHGLNEVADSEGTAG